MNDNDFNRILEEMDRKIIRRLAPLLLALFLLIGVAAANLLVAALHNHQIKHIEQKTEAQ